MTKKSKNISKSPWAIAKTKYRLNVRQIAMAKELGMNPKKFGKLVPNKSQQWKLPLPEFIEKCYRKRFGNKEPVIGHCAENSNETMKPLRCLCILFFSLHPFSFRYLNMNGFIKNRLL